MNRAGFESLFDAVASTDVRIESDDGSWNAAELLARVDDLADLLSRHGLTRVASQLDNGPAWVLLDLAVHRLGGVHVPLPTFFSPTQAAHALTSSAAQCLVTPASVAAPAPQGRRLEEFAGHGLRVEALPAQPELPPATTACVTYTSGTTGMPRGVCLSAEALLGVAASLVEAATPLSPKRHLCLMPLGTLLENIGGIYAPLLAGATVVVPGLAEIGYSGAAGLDVPTLLRCLHRHRPHSIILVPQLLLALVTAAEHGHALPDSLRYVAVGGARVGAALLTRAAKIGLPVFEGYGLTECASVVCLNRPGATRQGSVGRPLAHAQVRIVDGEIHVDGVRAIGYLGAEPMPDGPVRTGDLGHVDAEGFVHVTGRRKNVFITAFGRNVSPEWVESELLQHPLLAQAIVCGEARADNVAVLWPRRVDSTDASLARAIAEVNAGLPDYARVARFVRADAPFSSADGLLTANGRPRREPILARYAGKIELSYGQPANIPPSGVTA